MATLHPDQPEGEAYVEALKKAGFKGIKLDTAFVLRIMDESILRRFFQKHPIERFLFGTNSPFTDQKTELQFLNNLSFLTPSQKDKIAGHNAARLLNI